MPNQRRFAGFELTHLLLLVTTVELAFNRLAVRALRPLGEAGPPWWHQALDHFGLFSQYFASTLAIGIIGRHLWQLRARRDSHTGARVPRRGLYERVPRWGLMIAGAGFLVSAAFTILTNPGERGSFLFGTTFTLVLFFLVLSQTMRRGDTAAKLGLLLLTVPLAIPYYGPLLLWLGKGGEAGWVDLPERVRLLGQWSMVAAALATPYCFAPRPFMRAAGRLGPLMVALFVGAVGVVILRQSYEVGMRLAHQGLGVYIGPGAPEHFLAVYLLALCTITWTLTSCLGADAEARRQIGVGLALIVVSGYGFAWPLQYLVSVAGLLVISEAAARVAEEEHTMAAGGPGFRPPPIAEEVWEHYMRAVFNTLGKQIHDEKGASITVFGFPDDDGTDNETTNFLISRGGLKAFMAIKINAGAIVSLDIRFGDEPLEPGAEPQWTLYALPEQRTGVGAHPEPPATSAPVVRIDDAAFAERFRIRDAGGHTERLMDDDLRARVTELIDGWMTFWDGHALRYRVYPGQGAPLDHPIPITEMAFRGTAGPPSIERLLTLLDLLTEMAQRVLPRVEGAGTDMFAPVDPVDPVAGAPEQTAGKDTPESA